MDERRNGYCMICKNKAEIRHINMYVMGSEGLQICFRCESLILDFIRHLMSIVSTFRIQNKIDNIKKLEIK